MATARGIGNIKMYGMLTIKKDKADILAALDAGANDYLAKPFDAGELRAHIA